MRLRLPPQLVSVATRVNILVVSIVGGGLYVLIDGVLLQGKSSSLGDLFIILYMILLPLVAFVGGIVFLLRRKFLRTLAYFCSIFIVGAFFHTSDFVKGDRFAFTGAPHSEISAIYKYLRWRDEISTEKLAASGPLLIHLDESCGPPWGCDCWIVFDPTHVSGVENDVGKWHEPQASIFRLNPPSTIFALVNVRRVDADAFSVLACRWDPSSWWLR